MGKEHSMKHDFNFELDRHGTNSVKWEFFVQREGVQRLEHSDRSFGHDRVIPMWVADMDFRCPEAVIEALVERAKHGIFGYSAPTAAFHQSLVDWMRKRHRWRIQSEWLCSTPGVVPALNMMVRTFTEPGEAVLIQPPVYHPFSMAIINNGRQVVTNPLNYANRHYTMDFDDLEAKIRTHHVKMAILCHPHNPVGRVWTREELQRFAEICRVNDVLVISDEIHGDLIYSGIEFMPFAMLGQEFEESSITCTAPSKTFNLAGLHTSNIIIADSELRQQFVETLRNNGLTGLSTFGIVAQQAAYQYGEPWLTKVMSYVEDNYKFLEAYVREYLPKIKVVQPEGTYLVWLDCRALGLDAKALERLMLDEAKVYLDEGYIFGPEGEGFERINMACPRSLLQEALERIRDAVLNLDQENNPA
jgi:cystathionine beta-lyase